MVYTDFEFFGRTGRGRDYAELGRRVASRSEAQKRKATDRCKGRSSALQAVCPIYASGCSRGRD
jgi:hypothetical protein